MLLYLSGLYSNIVVIYREYGIINNYLDGKAKCSVHGTGYKENNEVYEEVSFLD